MNFKTLTAGIMLAGALGITGQAKATTFTVDDFNSGDVSLSDLTVNATPATGNNVLANGLTRNFSDNLLASVPGIQNTAEVGFGVLDITNGTGEDSEIKADWTLPAGFIDPLLTNLQFFMTVVASDGNPTNIGLFFAGNLLQNFAIPGNTFNTPLGISLTPAQISDIAGGGNLELRINGAPGWDATFDAVGFTNTLNVPEPGSLALMGLGLVGFAAFRKKQA